MSRVPVDLSRTTDPQTHEPCRARSGGQCCRDEASVALVGILLTDFTVVPTIGCECVAPLHREGDAVDDGRFAAGIFEDEVVGGIEEVIGDGARLGGIHTGGEFHQVADAVVLRSCRVSGIAGVVGGLKVSQPPLLDLGKAGADDIDIKGIGRARDVADDMDRGGSREKSSGGKCYLEEGRRAGGKGRGARRSHREFILIRAVRGDEQTVKGCVARVAKGEGATGVAAACHRPEIHRTGTVHKTDRCRTLDGNAGRDPVGGNGKAVIGTLAAGSHHPASSHRQRRGTNSYWHFALGRGVVTQLAVIVVAPRNQRAVRAPCHAVPVPGRNGDHRSAGERGQTRSGIDSHRSIAKGRRGVVAQLAIIAISPRDHRAVRAQHQIVVGTGGHGDDGFSGKDTCRHVNSRWCPA